VAAVTPADHEVHIVDEAVEAIDLDESADLIGIGIMTSNSLRATRLPMSFAEDAGLW